MSVNHGEARTIGDMWRDYFLEVRKWERVPISVSFETAQEFATWAALHREMWTPEADQQA